MYDREQEMYPEVIEWFRNYLSAYHKRSKIEVFNTSQLLLSRFLETKDYHRCFREYLTFEIKVDITGIIRTQKRAFLCFIECKLKPITLKDISQLLGYSRVAQPLYSLIISPRGISKSMNYLLKTFNRYDVLKYNEEKSIRVASWDYIKREIDIRTLLPPGKFLAK